MKLRVAGVAFCLQLVTAAMASAQTPSAPTLLRMSGTLLTESGQPRAGTVVLVSALYAGATDATALWTEQQTVQLDADGRYALNVGATLATGVPSDVFTAGAARYLGIAVLGEAEPFRTMLVSVPYAIKSQDTDALAGKPAGDYVLSEALNARLTSITERTPSLTVPDTLTVQGFGSHTFSAGAAGFNEVAVRNTAAGTNNGARLSLQNDTLDAMNFQVLSSNFGSFGPYLAHSGMLDSGGVGGLALIASNGAGHLRLFSGGLNERMRVAANGNVGIGTINPLAKLDINGTVNVSGFGTSLFSAGAVGFNQVTIQNTAAGAGNGARLAILNDTLDALNIQTLASNFGSFGPYSARGGLLDGGGPGGLTLAASNPTGILRIFSGGLNERLRVDAAGNVGIGVTVPTAKLDVAGNINVSGNINAKYQDVAEWVPSTEPLEDGTVVIVDPDLPNQVVTASQGYDTRVAGAVSRQPGLILGEAGDGKEMVATNGRVRIKVDASYGAVKIGDLLVTSPTPGHAMLSTPVTVGGVTFHRAGTLLGKALEALPNGKGEILVLLMLQ